MQFPYLRPRTNSKKTKLLIFLEDIRSCCRSITRAIMLRGFFMREYIIYSAIIFLPIGAIMSFQLSREGLMAKFIAVIMVASLGIIISFPIALQRLGLFAALLLYALLLLALTWYFLKSLQSDEGTLASTEDRSIIEDDLVGIYASHQIETTEIASVIEDDVIRPSYDIEIVDNNISCLLYTSPSPRD